MTRAQPRLCATTTCRARGRHQPDCAQDHCGGCLQIGRAHV